MHDQKNRKHFFYVLNRVDFLKTLEKKRAKKKHTNEGSGILPFRTTKCGKKYLYTIDGWYGIRIPFKQPIFHGKSPAFFVFRWLKKALCRNPLGLNNGKK